MLRFRRVVRLLPLLPFLMLCASCSGFFVSDSSTASVTVNPTALILKAVQGATPGDTFTLSASATTVGGTTTDETSAANFTSSDPTVVTAASGGVLKVVGTAADGTTVITATFGGQNAICNVLTFTGTQPTTLVVNGPASAVAPGQGFRVTATAALSGNATHDISNFVTWTSNAPSVATVDAKGNVAVLVTATAGANFTITATANFASGNVTGTSAQFTIPLV